MPSCLPMMSVILYLKEKKTEMYPMIWLQRILSNLPLFALIFDQNSVHRIQIGDFVVVFGRQIQIFEALVWFVWVFPCDTEQRFHFFGKTNTRTTVDRDVNLNKGKFHVNIPIAPAEIRFHLLWALCVRVQRSMLC